MVKLLALLKMYKQNKARQLKYMKYVNISKLFKRILSRGMKLLLQIIDYILKI